MCISIDGMECAGELVAALTDHAEKMKALFKELTALTNGGVDDESQYAPFFDRYTTMNQWYKSRKRVANSMKSATNRRGSSS